MVVVEGVEVPDEQAARVLINQRNTIVQLRAQLEAVEAGRVAYEAAFAAAFFQTIESDRKWRSLA